MSGFVVIHRSLLGHPDFRNDAEAMAFAWMVMRASWKPVRVRYKGKAVSLERGQLCVSQRDMAAALDRDKGWVERLWKRLQTQGAIEVDRGAAAMIITICNYAKYQDKSDKAKAVDGAEDEADARQGQGTEQRREQLNKKQVIIEPNGSNKRARKDFVLPDWVPVEPWDGYCAMRKAIKKPLTDRAKVLAINNLDRLRNEGHEPARVLDQSTEASWQGLFAVKGDYDGRNNNQRGGYNGAERDNRTGFERACDRIIEQSADSNQRREDAGAGSNRLLPAPDSPAML